ncbi:mucin-12-like [Schistocerca piceifrons]|uniref:mucin-12-like n=1 Tax=Schistocerca piceifrons TaxID=274613 RepID=UPI001F5FBB40|nr:mucin-12-like [Schistocerca piceifrons]
MESFTNSCRLCLWKGDKMLPIFASPDDDETALKIRKCLPLDVRWEDSLPKGICASCLYKVEMLFEFHCSAVRIDSLLRKYLASEVTVKEQQLSGSGYQTTNMPPMRSVAIGTEDEYFHSARRTRDGQESSGNAEPMVARLRVRTPHDISDMSSAGVSPVVQVPLQQSDPFNGHITEVSSLPHRSDSVQGIDSIHAIGATEQSPSSSTVLRLSASGTAVQQEELGRSASRQSEPVAHTSSPGEACVTQDPTSDCAPAEDTDVVCLSVKSSPTVVQSGPSTSRPSCECADDDEVVVLAEIQKQPYPYRRCKTPTSFDTSSVSSCASASAVSTSSSTFEGGSRTAPPRKVHRLCPRHQEYLRLMNLQQEQQRMKQRGLQQQETLQRVDHHSSRASGQEPTLSTSSASLRLSDVSNPVQCEPTQQVPQNQSCGGGTRQLSAETPHIDTSSNSTESEGRVQLLDQNKLTSGATSHLVALLNSDSSHITAQPGQLEQAWHVMRTKPEGATTEAVVAPLSSSAKCNSSVTEPQDQVRQLTLAHPKGTTVESFLGKPCGSKLSSADAPLPAAALSQSAVPTPSVAAASPVSQLSACVPPSAAPPATPAVPPPSSESIPVTAPPPSTMPIPSATLSTTSKRISSAALPTSSVPVSSTALPGMPVTTQSDPSPVTCAVTPSVAHSGITSHPSRAAAHSPSPARSSSGGQSPSTVQTSSSRKQSNTQSRSRSRSSSKSPSAGQRRGSKSPVSTAMAPPSASPKPSAPSTDHAQPRLAPLTTSVTWPLPAAPTTPPALLRASAQPQQQENRQQRVVLPTRGSGHPEHQVIPAKLQDGVFKFPAFLVVTNAPFHAQAQSPAAATTHLSAQSQTSAPTETPAVPKEQEQKQQLAQTESPEGAISQLLAASALISPPRGSTEPKQQEKKQGEVQTKPTGTHLCQSAAACLPTAPPHSPAPGKQHEQQPQVQHEQQKNRLEVLRDKLSAKIGRLPAGSPVDTDEKGVSVQNGQTHSEADQQLTNAATTTATSHTVAQSSKRRKEHRSHAVVAERPVTPAESTAASPTSQKPKQIKQKYYKASSQTEKRLRKSPLTVTSTAKSSSERAKNQLSGGTVEQQQTTKQPALPNSYDSQKWKKKKKKKKEKEEEESHHQSSNKYQQEQLSQKRKHSSKNTRETEDLPSQPAPTPSLQQSQEMEAASQHYGSHSHPVTTMYKVNIGEAEQPQVERWRNVQQDAVERVRVALRECTQLPQPPLCDPATSPPVPSATVTTPSPPVLTPQWPSVRPVPPDSPSPLPPMLPPAISTKTRTDRPHSTGPLVQCTTPPANEKLSPTPFLTPPDGVDQQKSRSQLPSKATAESGERRLRTPSPASSIGSIDWFAVPHRNGVPPRRYYNRKRRYLDLSWGEASGTDREGSEDRGDSAERSPLSLPSPKTQASCSAPKSSVQASAACLELFQQSVPSVTAPHQLMVGTPLLTSRSARAARYLCRYCQQRFSARILLSLHRVNGACELHRSHNYARNGGGGDHPQVTERELMLEARVRLDRLFVCPRCSRVLSTESTLKRHIALRHGHDNPRDTRASVQVHSQDWTLSLPDTSSPPPLSLPLAARLSDGKDDVLEALGLTRKS